MFVLLQLFCWDGLQLSSATEKFDFNSMTDAQQRQIFSPQLVSGDDIREGKIAQRKMNISKMMRGDSATEGPAGLKNQVYNRGPVRLRSKAGVLFSAAIFHHPAIDAVLPQVPRIFSQSGLVPVPTNQLQSVLNNFRYRNQLRNPLQIGCFLAEYPGTRYLFLLQSILFPPYFPGNLRFSYLMVDGISARVYPLNVLERPVRGPRELTPVLHSCFVEMANKAASLAATAPWQGKVFLVQGRLVYLSAGQESGLFSGQRLLVNGVVNPVRDPRTGMIVGSVPGPAKAQLQIQRFFGDDLAEAVIIAGGGVRIGDIVVPVSRVSR